MVVACAMQSFAREQQQETVKTPQSAQSMKGESFNNEQENDASATFSDREEGEIIDEFEMIISSEDEEFKLRARIQQLEDKSKDIEKMEMLSANLSNQYNYPSGLASEKCARYHHFSPISILSDVSSMSEAEYEPPRKYRKHKTKRTEYKKTIKRYPFANRAYPQQQTQQARKKRKHDNYRYHNHQQSANMLNSYDSMTDSEHGEYDDDDDNEDLERLKLSRDKLRVALARTGNYDIKPKHSLKERLQCRLRKPPSPEPNLPADAVDGVFSQEQQLPPNSFDGYSRRFKAEEPPPPPPPPPPQLSLQSDESPEIKLRLIALKSAILKKHMARKKRDAERAYSPTDMINRVHKPNASTECDDLDDLMEISPATSPDNTVQSPPPPSFEPVDMELVDSDSDDDAPAWSNGCHPMSNAGGSWRCFMPNSLPPPVSMPIVIDDEDDELGQRRHYDVPPPPPPPFNIPEVHMLEDDDARDGLHMSERHSHHGSLIDLQSISMDNSQTQTEMSQPFQMASSDDEAGALRAMLLSKLKPTSNVMLPEETSEPAQPAEESSDMHDSDDPEALRLLLLSSIASKKKTKPEEPVSASPEILKMAVRRFQSVEPQSNVQPPQVLSEELPVAIEAVPVPVSHLAPQMLHTPELTAVPVPVPMPVPSPQAISAPAKNIFKIVKPNKVINKKTTPKRKVSKGIEPAPPVKRPATLLVKEPVAPLHTHNSTSSTRLITKLDPAIIKVQRLVIALAEESSAGSDDELELRGCLAFKSYSSYADNASPLSLAMDSASNSTTRSNTPNSEILDSGAAASSNSNLRRTVINEYFEKRVDDFLKQARSQAPPAATPLSSSKANAETVDAKKKPLTVIGQNSIAVSKPTPVAVKHLPVASQREYLRLVERMQLLEKKKICIVKSSSGNSIAAAKSSPTSTTKENTAAVKRATNLNKPRPAAAKPNLTTPVVANKAVDSQAIEQPSTSAAAIKIVPPSKESRLKAFENSFHKIGGSMILNLDKSRLMVEEAMKSKIARLRCSKRLKELHEEMLAVKQEVKVEETKLARLQPEIQASHEIIISLKQKRNKLRNAAMDLGNGLRGADYRLPDPGKAEVVRKSTELTKEIRLYNSIAKFEDIARLKLDSSPDETPATATANVTALDDSFQLSSSYNELATINCDSQAQNDVARTETQQLEKQQEQEQSTASSDCTGANQLNDDTPAAAAAPTPTPTAVPSQSMAQDSAYSSQFMRQLNEAPTGASLLGEYRTPMSRNYNSLLNVNATVCPFELMGRCEDTDCSYLHLKRVTSESILKSAAK
ncbi:CG4294 [Drosophila busckii]|uniref:CG4294 n=1 Tax=Drosophila busckii TaxID=30019 RepID=A0A0M4E8Q2_DROBS|nr:uncharacterized protein LOC108597190 [Drosophila busckii]ALC41146.1 CG4294 [Drosophila busckii]